jgi:hypothetical protein
VKRSIDNAASCAGAAVSGAALGFPIRMQIAQFEPANFTNILCIAYPFRRCSLIQLISRRSQLWRIR